MAIPAYLWLKDDGNNIIVASVDVAGREGAIEVLGLNHGVMLSTDNMTGKTTAVRDHYSGADLRRVFWPFGISHSWRKGQ